MATAGMRKTPRKMPEYVPEIAVVASPPVVADRSLLGILEIEGSQTLTQLQTQVRPGAVPARRNAAGHFMDGLVIAPQLPVVEFPGDRTNATLLWKTKFSSSWAEKTTCLRTFPNCSKG